MKFGKREQVGLEIEKEAWYEKEIETVRGVFKRSGWTMLKIIAFIAGFYILCIVWLGPSAYSYSDETYNAIISKVAQSITVNYEDENSSDGPVSGIDRQGLYSILDKCTSEFDRKNDEVNLVCIVQKSTFFLFDAKVEVTLTPDYNLKEEPKRNYNSIEQYSAWYEWVRFSITIGGGLLSWFLFEYAWRLIAKIIQAIGHKFIMFRNKRKASHEMEKPVVSESTN